MPATYEPIATTTLGSAATTISFGSIANTYTDLRLVLVGTTTTSVSGYLYFNTDTSPSGTNYSTTRLIGSGTAASSNNQTSQPGIQLFAEVGNWSTTTPGMLTIDIFSYAGSTFKTCLLTESNDLNGSGGVQRAVGLWRSTSAITTVRVDGNNTFKVGTTATLYGILKA
jgi:hypothetical protein